MISLPRLVGPVAAALALAVTGCASGGARAQASDDGSGARLSPRLVVDRVAPAPTRAYQALVVSESVDEISRITFDSAGTRVDKVIPVGMSLIDPDGPHGVSIAPDGEHYYVTTAHGLPGGNLWKFRADRDEPVARATLGPFPATAQVSPNGWFAWVVNFNLHGEMVTSSVSVVETGSMVEVARIPTCTMPHGSRLTADGSRHYSACMMDDMLVEIDAASFEVSRHFVLTQGKERGISGAPPLRTLASSGEHAEHDMSGHGMTPPAPGDVGCSPTWAQPAPDGSRVWVACNKSSELVEIDATSWRVVRRVPAGAGIYNLAITSDARRIVASNKRGQSVSVFDAVSGEELARIPTSRRVVHGVAITADDRYAFVSNEGVGSERATVDVIDLQALQLVGTVEVGQQAGGIDVLR